MLSWPAERKDAPAPQRTQDQGVIQVRSNLGHRCVIRSNDVIDRLADDPDELKAQERAGAASVCRCGQNSRSQNPSASDPLITEDRARVQLLRQFLNYSNLRVFALHLWLLGTSGVGTGWAGDDASLMTSTTLDLSMFSPIYFYCLIHFSFLC